MGVLRRCRVVAIRAAAVSLTVFAASGVSACSDSGSPAAPESAADAGLTAAERGLPAPDLGTVIGSLVGEAELTAEQSQAISALTSSEAAPFGPRESWILASDLAGILTDEQVRSIESSMNRVRETHGSKVRARRGDRQERAGRPHGRGPGTREGARTGESGAEQEQRQTEGRARREARWAEAHAAMAEVLDLTEAQSEALRARAAERPDGATGPQWRESRRQAIASILTDEQQQVVILHRLVLGHRMRAATGAGLRHRPAARVHGGWGS